MSGPAGKPGEHRAVGDLRDLAEVRLVERRALAGAVGVERRDRERVLEIGADRAGG